MAHPKPTKFIRSIVQECIENESEFYEGIIDRQLAGVKTEIFAELMREERGIKAQKRWIQES
jgi:hypothetical protein